MIYSNFYPIVGEYEKRELYDDVDGKYAAYWIKRMIESDGYILKNDDKALKFRTMNLLGYMRFECKNMSEENNQREMCKGLVNLLEVAHCDKDGNGCDIFITRYQIGTSSTNTYTPDFKEVIRDKTMSTMTRKEEFCYDLGAGANDVTKSTCYNRFYKDCCIAEGLWELDANGNMKNGYIFNSRNIEDSYPNSEKTPENNKIAIKCKQSLNDKVFNTAAKDYILSLPNFSKRHFATQARFRVIIIFHHTKDDNDFYSFSNMEVNK